MFEGETTITFAKEAANAMLSQVLTKLFEMPIEVSSASSDYKGLCVEFAPKGYAEAKRKQDEESRAEFQREQAARDKAMPEGTDELELAS